ncbi:MAG: SNF2-related protein [Fusobacteriaceae bacterium]
MENSNKNIFFVLKENEKGIYVVATSVGGQEISNLNEWLIEDSWLEISPKEKQLLSFLDKSKNKNKLLEWDNFWNEEQNSETETKETYLADEPKLVELLLESGSFVSEDFIPIEHIKDGNSITLNIKESLHKEEILMSELVLNNVETNFVTIEDKYAYCKGKIYNLEISNKTMYELENLRGEFKFSEAESFLTIFKNCFENIQLNFLDYSSENSLEKKIIPQMEIEKISQDNSLYLKLNLVISTMDYKFLTENNIKEIANINVLEKKVVFSKIETSELKELLNEIVKLLTKYQKNLKIKSGYYLDEENLFILQEKLAKEFIGKELLRLATKYKVLGTEKLKKYNIKAVKPKIVGSFKHSIDFLEGEVDIEIEGEKFSILDILSTYKKDSYIVLSDGTNALINHKYIEKLQRLFKEEDGKKVKISFFDLPLIDEMIDDKVFSQEFNKSREFFLGINKINDYDIKYPKIEATLREYQEYGYKWLSYLIDNNLGGCLADDMGLGKTLQAITLLSKVHLNATKPSLVVMPKSLIYNWENEIKRFNPSLKSGIYYGNNRDLEVFKNSQVVLTTYGTIRNDISKLKEYEFQIIILDESQNIKNVNAQTTKAIMLLNSENRIALSGTPIENNLSELYSLFRFLNPGMFGTLEEFNSVYANPIQKDGDKEVIAELRQKIYPFILRRLKKEVLKDLPEKIEQTVFIEMNKEQKKFYEERRMYYYNMINTQIKELGLGKAQFYVLQALNELRQITSCPEVKNEKITSSKREMLINNISDAVVNGHKVLVFTNYVKSIENICSDLEKQGIKHLSMTGATKDRQSLVDKFQKDSSYKVFVMTLKTGGVGLNLTSADTIFIYDPWWNKTVENQAVDRAYRLGQDRTVFSYKLILKDSIEEKILKLQEMKSELLDNLISEDSSSVKFLTEQDIKYILGE